MLQFFAVSGFTFPRRSDGGVRIYKEESERGGGGGERGKGKRKDKGGSFRSRPHS